MLVNATPQILSDFNPLPRKEGDYCIIEEKEMKKYFNPLPRKEGDSKFR